MPQLYGYILNWNGYSENNGSTDYRQQLHDAISSAKDFQVDTAAPNKLQGLWQDYIFNSTKAVVDHDKERMMFEGPYTYKFKVRVNSRNGTVIIVSAMHIITDAVINYFNYKNRPNLNRKIINIQKITQKLLIEKVRDYAITYYLADIPGYGTSLKSITLYGTDIADAEFLEDERANFSARKIGIRPFSSPFESGRFSNNGIIQFRSENIKNLEEFLSYAHLNELYIE